MSSNYFDRDEDVTCSKCGEACVVSVRHNPAISRWLADSRKAVSDCCDAPAVDWESGKIIEPGDLDAGDDFFDPGMNP